MPETRCSPIPPNEVAVPVGCRPIHRRMVEIDLRLQAIEETLGADGSLSRQERKQLTDEAEALRNECAVRQRELDQCIAITQVAEAPPTSNLEIAGIERTQGIQFFLFNGLGTGSGPKTGQFPTFGQDNFLETVALKPMIFRVYVNRTTSPEAPVPNTVTGRVKRRRLFPLPEMDLPPLSPINPGGAISARASNTINRGNPNHTLNFRLPQAENQGHVSYTVEVFDPAHPGEDAYTSPPSKFDIRWNGMPPIRIHGVLINYTGPDAAGNPTNLPAPSMTDFVNLLTNWVLRVFPAHTFTFTGFTTITFDGDMNVGPVSGTGGCGSGWIDLLNRLQRLRGDSDTNDIYVGLLPLGTPTENTGCGRAGKCAAILGVDVAFGRPVEGPTMAHEVAHAFCMLRRLPPQPGPAGQSMHAPCGGVGISADPNYPSYQLVGGTVLPSGSIGEFGFDPVTSQVYNPFPISDFMGYCRDVWISEYTFRNLRGGIMQWLRGEVAGPERGGGRGPEGRGVMGEHLYLSFRVHRGERVELLSAVHLSKSVLAWEGPGEDPQERARPPIYCELLDAEGRVLISHRCQYSDPRQDPDGPYLDYHEVLPWDSEARSMSFVRQGEVIHTIGIEEQAPDVSIEAVERVEESEAALRIEWSGGHPEKSVTYDLRYSNDGGQTWRGVATNLSETSYVVDLDLLPGGEQCIFQVVASADIRTATAETEPYPMPYERPRQAHIFSPAPDATFAVGDSVVLRGAGFSPDFGSASFEDMVWTSTIDGFIGHGDQVITHTLSVGRHKITFSVPDGLSGEASARVSIKIAAPSLEEIGE